MRGRIETEKQWPELHVTGLVDKGDSEARRAMIYVVSNMPTQLFKELMELMGIVYTMAYLPGLMGWLVAGSVIDLLSIELMRELHFVTLDVCG